MQLRKTKIYNWFYKTGRGDEGEHTGPMAGDVRKHMGEEAAPGGKSLDLTTVNGFVMAFLSLEKLNDLNIPGLSAQTPMRFDSSQPWQRPFYKDTTATDGWPSIAHFIKSGIKTGFNRVARKCQLGGNSIKSELLIKTQFYDQALLWG